jgi:hypothetical protein
MDYILNELSVPNGTSSIIEARRVMSDFTATCAALRSIGFTSLRIQNDLYSISLSDGYLVSQWMKDPEVDRDLALRFKSISKNSPYIPDTEEEANEIFANSDFYFKGEKSIGLGVSQLLNTVAISFQTRPDWLNVLIDVDHHMVHLIDQKIKIAESNVKVKNAFDEGSAKTYKQWFEGERMKSLRNTAELWKRRTELFGQLIFCDGVEAQLGSISLNDEGMDRIKERLIAVDKYCTDWTEGHFDHTKIGFKISGESEATLNRFGEERTFRIPSGEYKLFEDHFKLGDIRIHILVDNEQKRVYVGYIGKHLPTVRFN